MSRLKDDPLRAENETVSSHRSWPRVLLVEDDESQVLALTIGLEREGLAVTAVRDGNDALATARQLQPDIIVLDVRLPGLSGIEICRELRSNGDTTPIVFVSSRSEELDVVVGIEVGADDYLTKPYRMRELVARISALLRRRRDLPEQQFPEEQVPHRKDMLSSGDVILDPDRHEVFVRNRQIELPLREFQVLRELLSNSGRVVTREAILDRVWGFEYDGDPRIVATLIARLRAHIERDPENPTHISTIRGVGYRFNDRH